ncbi:MAG: D-alanyl-D-alanine carboxypeptidase [Rhodobacteraceae bacterium]|nr:D-alanyl-D-alanine carboxypeptidase [Paracoccaceae bacterium]
MQPKAVLRVFSALFFICFAPMALTAPYAAVVIDARTGEVLHARNADARLHPASLTKMMTLYVAFDAVERGEIGLDTKVKISRFAANEQPSKLGLKPGQRIALRYLIRAAAVKSANDASTAIAEAISGSEIAFARRMTDTARKLGMKNTAFKNAHGLTQRGHFSTARDMTLLGRRLFFDFPAYYNLFSRKSTHAGVREVANTNRKLLSNYRGADGIKTGYTRAAGFNLVASARRGSKHVIATMFGGKSAASRNARVAELLNMGFHRSRSRVAVRKPARVNLADDAQTTKTAVSGTVKKSLRPRARPVRASSPELMAQAREKAIKAAILAANQADDKAGDGAAKAHPALGTQTITAAARGTAQGLRVVTRVSASGSRYWGVQVGTFASPRQAERALLQTALKEIRVLNSATRRIDKANVKGKPAYRARFVGLSQAEANMTCARLRARNAPCLPIGPNL